MHKRGLELESRFLSGASVREKSCMERECVPTGICPPSLTLLLLSGWERRTSPSLAHTRYVKVENV